MTQNKVSTIVIGHRNPDTDSIASAHALAELRRFKGITNVTPACAGLPGERTEYIFNRFKVPLPALRNDVHPRVSDIMTTTPLHVRCGNSLLEAFSLLEKNHVNRLPVIDQDNNFCGMLSLFRLLGDLIQSSGAESGSSLTGRAVRSSVSLILEVLKGEALSLHNENEIQDFEVYVAAMNIESFKEHIPRANPEKLTIVVGDRADIHLMAINIGARIMIITGARQVDEVVVQAARAKGVSIIQTPFDSATVIRRLKFSCPVELLTLPEVDIFRPEDRLADIRRNVMMQHEDIFPVVDEHNRLLGAFSKSDIDYSPFNLILVDHNEFDNGVEGIEEVPVIEVVDHHRLSMPATTMPIRITCDIVGSTCTLVTEMFINEKAELSQSTAGVLMGGIISDTLMLRSPTTTDRDRTALDYLQNLTGVNAEKLTEEIFQVGSLIARLSLSEVLTADKKNFCCGKLNFAIAQIEEVSFEQFSAREEELLEQAKVITDTENLDFFGLLITNIIRENSILLAVGSSELLRALPYRKIHEHLYDLPGILSRKKQLLPHLLKAFGEPK
ncbi:MAG: putative manganese-dependent inorganic diphosphatase [Victivallaceae bacterium]